MSTHKIKTAEGNNNEVSRCWPTSRLHHANWTIQENNSMALTETETLLPHLRVCQQNRICDTFCWSRMHVVKFKTVPILPPAQSSNCIRMDTRIHSESSTSWLKGFGWQRRLTRQLECLIQDRSHPRSWQTTDWFIQCKKNRTGTVKTMLCNTLLILMKSLDWAHKFVWRRPQENLLSISLIVIFGAQELDLQRTIVEGNNLPQSKVMQPTVEIPHKHWFWSDVWRTQHQSHCPQHQNLHPEEFLIQKTSVRVPLMNNHLKAEMDKSCEWDKGAWVSHLTKAPTNCWTHAVTKDCKPNAPQPWSTAATIPCKVVLGRAKHLAVRVKKSAKCTSWAETIDTPHCAKKDLKFSNNLS